MTNIDPPVEAERALAAEDAYVAAEITSDEAALRTLVDGRFVMNSNDGTTAGKEELIGSVLRMNMTGQTISERSVTIDGGTAIICGTTEIRTRTADDTEQRTTLRYTSVYVQRQGDWRMLALHMTPRSPRP